MSVSVCVCVCVCACVGVRVCLCVYVGVYVCDKWSVSKLDNHVTMGCIHLFLHRHTPACIRTHIVHWCTLTHTHTRTYARTHSLAKKQDMKLKQNILSRIRSKLTTWTVSVSPTAYYNRVWNLTMCTDCMTVCPVLFISDNTHTDHTENKIKCTQLEVIPGFI